MSKGAVFEPQVQPAAGGAAAAEPTEALRKARVIAFGVIAGLVLTLVWSFEFVDSTIGDNVANNVLGYDAKEEAITGIGMGIVFAFVSGVAGTFTACNIAAFSAIAPLASQRQKMGDVLKPLGWLALGACAVAAPYGAIGALIGSDIPQLSQDMVGNVPVRIIQASVIFGAVGLVLIYLALTTLKVIPDPLAGLWERRPRAQIFVMGLLIGAFLIGRPFPLFHKMFDYAASTNNPAFGAGAFVLQSLGNILIMGVVFVALAYYRNGAFPRWLNAVPGRATRITAAALMFAGTFTFVYWVIRVPAHFDIGWWPTMPWN